MDERKLKMKNPWRDVTVDNLLRPVRDLGSLTSREAYISGEDRDYVLDNKLQFELGGDYRFHLELPPEPWQGNPLTAKVIILTLNPGYVESANTVIARLLKKASCDQELCSFKNRVLRFDVESLMPEINNNESGEVSLFEAFNALGDWYWFKGLSKLLEDYKHTRGEDDECKLENDFYKYFAILEYCPYTSKKYKSMKAIDELPSVKYSIQLLEEIVGDKNKLIILHRGREWKKHLNAKDYIELLNPRCPYLTIGNLGEKNYQILLDALK